MAARMNKLRLCLVPLLLLAGTAAAQPAPHTKATAQPAAHSQLDAAAFPADVITHHTLQTGGRTLHFMATAGTDPT